MKNLLLLFLCCCISYSAITQWSDKTNYFTDSMHMPVCTEAQTQQHPMIIKSYPDGGYIIYWEDQRNNATTKQDIYAQKFDKNGNRLWALNGVPVVKGTNDQHFYTSTNADYRNYSYAATDSNGGFYIAYIDDSITNYAYYRICVQHVRSNGTPVFKGAGYIIAESKGNNYAYSTQQLIADGRHGFFLGYLRGTDLFVSCYKEVAGTLQYYGGGQMNINAYEQQIGSCNNYTLAYRDAAVSDYMIHPDLQNGCNVDMTMAQNAGGNDRVYTGFNRLIRVKKQSTVTTNDPTPQVKLFKRDSVIVFYKVYYHTYRYQCGNELGTGYILESNGYLQTSNQTYGAVNCKGAVVPTEGNINVDITTFVERKYLNNTLTNWFTHAFYRRSEKFDSIPYEFTIAPYQPRTYLGAPKPGLNKINATNDTIMYNGSSSDYDYCLVTSGNKVYSTAILNNAANTSRDVVLQQLQVLRQSPDSFAIVFGTTNHWGIKVGKELSTSYGSLSYNNPQIAMDNAGNALFYIRNYLRPPKVSPIINGSQLAWGAMGRNTGIGLFNGYYYPDNPYAVFGIDNGAGLIAWQDSRNYPLSNGLSIFMRHLDSLTKTNYAPVYKPVKLLPYGGGLAEPAVLTGSSKHYSLIEFFDAYSGYASPVIEIMDKLNLGSLSTSVYDNTAATIRTYNSKPYLDRNFTLHPEISPTGSAYINLRLFFTKTAFNALKAADPTVQTPTNLAVIKQPYTTTNAPTAYSPISGEVKVNIQSWKAVAGGYYIQIQVNKFNEFTNYYIFPASATLPLRPAVARLADHLFTGTFIEKIYPTITTDGRVYIETGNQPVKEMQVEVYNATGMLCFKLSLPYHSQSIHFNELSGGVYIVRITSGNLTFTSKIVLADRIRN